jgi:hypothetical protein
MLSTAMVLHFVFALFTVETFTADSMHFYQLFVNQDDAPQAAQTPRPSRVRAYGILLISLTIFLLGSVGILVLVITNKHRQGTSSSPMKPSVTTATSPASTRGPTTDKIPTLAPSIQTTTTARESFEIQNRPPTSDASRVMILKKNTSL